MPEVMDPGGSIWRRWDPHVHAPGTILNDQFGGSGSMEDYLDRLESATPRLEAIGITDYFSTWCYEAVLDARSSHARLPAVGLVFPNVEMRLSIETKRSKGINLHLLVSPDDPSHLQQLHRFLKRLTFDYQSDKYVCSDEDLIRLGRAFRPSASTDEAARREGANQFKVDFRQLRSEFEDSRWMRDNALVAVAGSSRDGTSGLQTSDSGFEAVRREIETFAHVIFSGNDQQARFWRGEGPLSSAELDAQYRGCKPCIHGSDAHCLMEVGAPDLDRRTWLKGDATFETLKQACLEPGTRVYVGPAPPDLLSPDRTLARVETPGTPWLVGSPLPINAGLVAIIGARGSGKTALADLLAHGGGNTAPLDTSDSFLCRAADFLGDASVKLGWSDAGSSTRGLCERPGELDAEVHYLSQQFVERLCSADAASGELEVEVQKVVFAAHEPQSRMEATSFGELLDARIGDTRRQREHLGSRMDRIAEDVLGERLRHQQLPSKERVVLQLQDRLSIDRKARDGIVKTGERERADYYSRLRSAIDELERKLQAGRKRKQRLEHLQGETQRYEREVFPDLLSELRSGFDDVGLSDADWSEFAIAFAAKPIERIRSHIAGVERTLERLEEGDATLAVVITSTPAELAMAPLKRLIDESAKVAAEIGIDKKNAQRLRTLNDRIATNELELEKAKKEVERCAGAQERLRSLSAARADSYRRYFELIVGEEASLQQLYQPLEQHLSEAGNTVGKLRLVVVRDVDLERWASRGELLIDLRKTGKFKGQGSLAAHARQFLLPAWQSGSATDVSAAMATFRAEFDRALIDQARADSDGDPGEYQQWTVDIGRWLYSTEHISVRYSFEYENLPLAQLSPGTRGVVLLLLYLALDHEDSRPLIIDQPEENLDPRSVFAELVSLFRAARSRRQVIIVTHNANLVVNTDVDQVIVASSVRGSEGGPPRFAYRSGSLENAGIRESVCDILEGGEAAFRERARRLRVRAF